MAKKSPANPTLEAIRVACANEAAAVEFFERARWGDTPACPRCGSANVYQMRNRTTGERNKDYRWRCRDCASMYTVRTGLILEETRLPLRVWALAFWRACASKKGVSALQISREAKISYKSALYLMHRLRYAMATDWTNAPKLSGVVEADETFVGGKPRYKGKGVRAKWSKKQAVSAMVQRGGEVRTRHIKRVTSINLQGAVRDFVDQNATLMTDEEASYKGIARLRTGEHHSVKHSAKEYVRGEVHTNTIEGFFSLIKRGIYGTFHSVSPHHLHRYLAEFEFRYNTRGLDDGARTVAAIRKSEGRRLLYASA
jgi:transposase-like protein